MKRSLVLYHDQCVDGVVAAWVCWTKLEDEADYLAVRYNEPVPVSVKGRDVYLVDFCYPPEVVAELVKEARMVVILDHHQTAIDAFNAQPVRHPQLTVIFDETNARSGAQIAADFFGLDKGLRRYVDYAGDRDTWKFVLPNSVEINAALAAAVLGQEPYTAFRELTMLLEVPHHDVISLGIGAKMQADAFVRQVVPEGRLVSFAGHKSIPLINMAKPFTSEVLHALCEGVPFAVSWRQEKETVVFSLRSKPDGLDVAKIAERFGGGGHKHAAGFTLPFESDDGWSALLGIEEVPP